METTLARIAAALGYEPAQPAPPDAGQLLGNHLRKLFSHLQINCVLDVGANQGQYGRFLRQTGYQGWIISFEPSPADFQVLAERSAADPDTVLKPEDLAAWEASNGRIPDGAFVALWTGWSTRWPERKAYLGDDTPGDASKLHFPSFGPEAVRWLLAERTVAAIGLDTASIDPGDSPDFPVHQIVGEASGNLAQHAADQVCEVREKGGSQIGSLGAARDVRNVHLALVLALHPLAQGHQAFPAHGVGGA